MADIVSLAMTCALLYSTHDLIPGPEVMLDGMDKENTRGLEVAWVRAGCVLVGYEDTLLRWNNFKEDLRCSSSDSNVTAISLNRTIFIQCSCPGCTVSGVSGLIILLFVLAVFGTGGVIGCLIIREKQRIVSPEITTSSFLDEETRL